jgi:hypothetical protein
MLLAFALALPRQEFINGASLSKSVSNRPKQHLYDSVRARHIACKNGMLF